jgi:hypothetical protein
MFSIFLSPDSKAYGRIAGLLYLIIAFCGGFSIMYVPSEIVAEAGAETVRNLQQQRALFSSGIAVDILTFSIEIVLTAMLYHLFRKVNGTFASIATYARFAMIVIMGVNLLIYLTPLVMLEQQASFASGQVEAMVNLAFAIHAQGILVWGIFFGIHLIFLGWLVRKSAHHPSLLGLLMQIGSLGYLLESINVFCFSDHPSLGTLADIFLFVVVVGELGFAIWLLVKGRKA